MVKGYGYYDGTGLPKINIVHKDDSSIYPDVMKSFEFGASVLFEEEKLRLAKVKPGIPGAFESTTTVCTDNMSASKKARWLVKKIIFNPPATIIFWSDGTKTVVKAHNEVFDPEKGIAMAFFKRFINVEGTCSHVSVMRKMIDTAEFHEPKKEELGNEESTLEFTSGVFADFVSALKKAIIKSGLANTVVENTTHTPENEEVPEAEG